MPISLSSPRCFADAKVLPPAEKESGSIKGYSVISKGEAQGHGLWIDTDFLEQVASAGSAMDRGFKTRSNHPSMCAPGFGTYLGRTRHFRREGSKVLADFEASPAADRAKLDHVFKMAVHEPDMFGASIVFTPDLGAMEKFKAQNKNAKGEFTSPDPANTANLPHARLAALHASDFVDEPAANNDGLFAAEETSLLGTSTKLLDFIFGIGPEPSIEGPLTASRIKLFVRNYLHKNSMSITQRKEPRNMQTPEALKALQTRFPKDPAFVLEAFNADLSIEAAETLYLQRENERLSKENAALVQAAKAAPTVSHSVSTSTPSTGPSAFDEKARAMATARNIDIGLAYRIVAQDYPELDRIENF